MRNILVLIDLDKDAANISKSALNIAQQLPANLVLSCLPHSVSLIEELHDHDGFLQDEKHFSDLEELADFLRHDLSGEAFIPLIQCIDLVDTESKTIKEFVAKNNIWMIIKETPELSGLIVEDEESLICNTVRCINCPHLFIPQHINFNMIDKIAYLTDLRYCDIGVLKFLKAFNAFIFITHISAGGLPDIAENYGQAILTEEIAIKTRNNKIFLRNTQRVNRRDQLEKVIENNAIQMCAVVNKKHQLLEEMFSTGADKIKSICQIPLLVFPFYDWFVS